MKALLAYTLLVIGIPNIIGLVVWSLIGRTAHLLYRGRVSVKDLQFLGIVGGLGSMLGGLSLFWLFGLHAGIAIPIIAAAWMSLYFFFFHQQAQIEWMYYLIGIFIGWFIFWNYFQTP